ncbi:nucleophile aminohydrolase [Mycena rosella]|uniref:Nucleophile aminohydrolase n=1 Tax=Mycena rosella TaxID=1033263 RepID=A0AAD7G5P9_MYCRO|nr:nucleophile aminohydrolase [Mycena rosella]
MCGLTSVFHPDGIDRPSATDLEHELEDSLEIIKHRGPDSRGIYISPDLRVGLGHVRLSIIDLSTGQQPMSDEAQLIHCVFNGELYDHERIRDEWESEGYTFKSKSVSELVVQLLSHAGYKYKRDGINLLFHLRGDFAFILYNVKRRFLFAARDRFGIKPLYYTVSNGRIMFASGIKAFMGLGWKAEWDIDSIVHNGQMGDERTVFKGVQKLAAGHFALCGASGYIRIERYWDMEYLTATSASPESTLESMVSTVRNLLVESVRLRFRSDVPLAVYLSGGIDSSAIAGIATHLLRESDPKARLTAFTLAFIEDETADESRTANHLGAEIILVNATKSALLDVIEEAIWHTEMPNTTFRSTGKILSSRAVRSNGYKVPTLFIHVSNISFTWHLGRSIWRGFRRDLWRLQLVSPGLSPTPLLAQASPYLPMWTGLTSWLTSNARLAFPNYPISHHVTTALTPFYRPMFHPNITKITGSPEIARCIAEGIDPRVRQNSISGAWHSLNVSLYVTTKAALGRFILNQLGDRADMVNSVESRIAFLDHHLVEYVNTLPPSVKIMPMADEKPGTWSFNAKWILHQAVKPFVTEEMYLRKKIACRKNPRSVEMSLNRLEAVLRS